MIWEGFVALLPIGALQSYLSRLVGIRRSRMVRLQAPLAAVIFFSPAGILAQQSPNSLESHYQLAQQAQKRADYPAAAEEWKAIVALSPKLAEAHANLGMMYQLLNRPKDAIESFDTAIRLNPNLSSVRLLLGIEYYLTSRPDLAIEQLQHAVRLRPQDSTARKWLGLSYLYSGDSGRAVPELRLCHQRDPHDDNISFNLNRAYFRLSMAAFRSVAATRPDSSWNHIVKGEQYVIQEAYPEALAEFQRALVADPASQGVHFRRAMVFETQGKTASAIEEYGKELLERPQHLESINQLVRLLTKLELKNEADELLSLGRISFEGHTETLALLGRTPEENPRSAGETEVGGNDALAAARSFLSGYAERLRSLRARSVGWTEKVQSALDRNDPEDALRLLASPPRIIKQDQVQEWKARALMARDDFDRGLDILQKLSLKEPDNAEYSYYLGECAERLALSILAEFVKTAPDSYRTYQLQGEYWVARRNFPKALTAYQKALALKPAASQIHLALGWIYLNQDRRDDAINQLQAELRADPYSVPALVGMGEVYYKQGQPDRAKTYLLEAVSINPNSPQAQMWLGKVSADAGSFPEAVEHFEAALKNGVYDRGAVYFQLSRALKQLGRNEAANRYLALYRHSQAEENRRQHFLSEDPEATYLAPSKD